MEVNLQLNEITGQTGVFNLLQRADTWGASFQSRKLLDMMDELDISDSSGLFDQLIGQGLFANAGGGSLSFTTKGIRTFFLLDAVNGADVEDVCKRLSNLYPNWGRYEVVRDRMTQEFIRELYDRPDFKRVYLCSRWMHLENRQKARFAQAVHWASEKNVVEILVVHGPVRPDDERDANLRDTLRFFNNLDAEIVINKRVHAKMYIREPGLSGGLMSAVVGSENLTIPKYAELGLKITNDRDLIGRLIQAFFDISSNGTSYVEDTNDQ